MVNTSIQGTGAGNTSGPDGCLELAFSKMEFVPWDNPDNIISAEVETITRRTKDILLAIVFLIGGPGNVINMAVFYKQGLKDRVNLCLFSLALADEVYLVGTMLMYGEQVHVQFTTGEIFGPTMTFLANIHGTIFISFSYISPVLSAIIASERCYCVLRPLNYHTLMRTRTMAATIIATYAVVLGLYFVVAFRYRIGCLYDPETGAVVKTFVMGKVFRANQALIEFLHGVIFAMVLPGFVVLVVTVTTIVTAVKLRQIVTWRAGTTASLTAREVGLTRMLIGSSVLFIVCVLPPALTRILWLLFPEMNSGRRNHNFFMTTAWVGQLLAFVNSSFNICVYYTMGTRYRETFWALLSRKRNTEAKGPDTNTQRFATEASER